MAVVQKSNSLKTKEVLLRLTEDFENFSRELLDGITSYAANKGQSKQFSDAVDRILKSLITKDEEIKHVIQIGEDQILRQQIIIQGKDEISGRDIEILQVENHLIEAEQIMSNALFDAKRKIVTSRQADDAMVSSEDLIRFAFRISSNNSTEAPSDWQPGDPRRPYPLDLEMRAGFLGQLSMRAKSDADAEKNLKKDNSSLEYKEKESSYVEMKPGILSAWDADRVQPFNSSLLSSKESNMPEQHPQTSEIKEQSYRMISVNAVQPRDVLRIKNTLNHVDIEYMSSSSDSSSCD